jgi:hypothetical protein
MSTKSTAVSATPAALITLADARKGKVSDVNAFVGKVREELQNADKVKGQALYDAALGFHAIVTTGENMTQGDYADALYGKVKGGETVKGSGRAMGTMLKRLSIAAVVLGVKRESREWRYLVQRGTNAETGFLGKMPTGTKAERDAVLAALKSNAAQWEEHGKVTQGARTPQPNDGTDSGEGEGSGEGSDTPQSSDTLSVDDVLKMLDAALKREEWTRETWQPVEDRLTALITREVTLLGKRDKAAAKSA